MELQVEGERERRRRELGTETEIRKAGGRGVASSWKNSHFGTQKMLLRRNDYPRRSEKKERNVYKEGGKKVERRRKVRERGKGERERERGGISLR